MTFRTRGLRVLLTLLLLFSQQQALLHGLGHELSQLSQKQDPADPRESVCAKCLAVAHLDHAVAGDVASLEPIRYAPPVVASTDVPSFDRPTGSPYRSRAPPTFS